MSTLEIAKTLKSAGYIGEVAFDETSRRLFATDASEYQEYPLGVAWPKSAEDVQWLIICASRMRFGLIPRTAGTSLAGQCVGSGLVMDLSRHFRQILDIDTLNKRVTVQPGVIRNDLNAKLAEYGLFFGPETSTANRAMIGGMVGNNSCGANSLVYGSTREHLVRVRGYLSDGSAVTFEALTVEEFSRKCEGSSLESQIYRTVRDILGDPANREEIIRQFPLPSIPRRNTGYALDLLMRCSAFDSSLPEPFNFCKLIAGSEGTLFVATEIELSCDPLPCPHHALLCWHFDSLEESLRGNLVALKHQPSAVELIDKYILECSRSNPELARKREFLIGDPAALLVIEFRRDTEVELGEALRQAETEFLASGLGYAVSRLQGQKANDVWDLRRAGQAVINNIPGDKKPREVAEDTAVDVRMLPEYVREFSALMQKHDIQCVYYGHAATGELHMRPIFGLHDRGGIQLFRSVAEDVAALVKRYRGSLSGEHGDGRLRGEFLQMMLGERCYAMIGTVKQAFDPMNILNPGTIFDSPPMDEFLRHDPEKKRPRWETHFDWSDSGGVVGGAEKCNGAGECLKTPASGGIMCPSYMATRKEEDSTRGRANLLRQLMTEQGREALASDELHHVLDLCLSCKGCKSECPSSVDLARLKAEFLQGYHDKHGVPFRSQLIAHFDSINRLTQIAPWAWNAVFGTPVLRRIANRLVGFHPSRSIPILPKKTLRSWFRTHCPDLHAGSKGEVFLFADEFTNFHDAAIGIKAVQLLERLGYKVEIPFHHESGRSSLSKGLLRRAKTRARKNVQLLHGLVSAKKPLVGIEPSALLSFRDEYPALLRGKEQEQAKSLAGHCLLLEEFIAREMDAGRITADSFTPGKQLVRVHGHCHQRSLVGLTPTFKALSLIPGNSVRLIPSGCCGMAGSFGYEREHYELSMAIGELALFPKLRQASAEDLICSSGTSCRHQIHDGTGRRALHPAEILWMALK